MNYFDYFIGLGLGVIVTIIGRAIADSKKEAKERERSFKNRTESAIEKVNHQTCGNYSLNFKLNELSSRLEKLEKRKR